MRKMLLALVLIASPLMSLAATPRNVVLHVRNITCPACSITIEKALDKVPGITAKRVDARAETVTVAFDADRTTTNAIAKAISEAGFPATLRKAATP